MAFPYLELLAAVVVMVIIMLVVAELVGLYAGTKGRDRSRWALRTLLYGPSLMLLAISFLKPSSPKFRKCPTCDRPVRIRAADCWFCHSRLPVD